MKTSKTLGLNPAAFRQIRALSVLLITVALVATSRNPVAVSALSVSNEFAVVLQTAGAPFLQGEFKVVNNEPGNQTNPHVECRGLATYIYYDLMELSTVNYQDLSTGADNIIPGNEVDLLSDVSGPRIAFAEVDFPGDPIVVFHTLAALVVSSIPVFNWTRLRQNSQPSAAEAYSPIEDPFDPATKRDHANAGCTK